MKTGTLQWYYLFFDDLGVSISCSIMYIYWDNIQIFQTLNVCVMKYSDGMKKM